MAQLPLTCFWCWNLTYFFSSTTPYTRLREQKKGKEWAAAKEDVLSLQKSPTTTFLFPLVPWKGASATSLCLLIPVQRVCEEGAILQLCCWREALLRLPSWNILRRNFISKSWGTTHWCCCLAHTSQWTRRLKKYGNDSVDFRTLLHKTQWIFSEEQVGKRSLPFFHTWDPVVGWGKVIFPPFSCSLLSSSWGSFPLHKAVLSAHWPLLLRQQTRLTELFPSFCSVLQNERHLQCCKRLLWWELTNCLKVLQKS